MTVPVMPLALQAAVPIVVALAVLLPVLLALGMIAPATRHGALKLAPWGAVPALLLVVAAPSGLVIEIPWLLIGARLGVDETSRPFLLLTALVWGLAGLYADAYLREKARRHVFMAFFLATQAGNLGVCLALDAVSFYFAFALMSFAAYGLVVHERTEAALRAGRVYLVMVVIGEGLLVAAFILAVAASGSHLLPELTDARGAADHPVVAALFVAGFGIKVGVMFVHVWLPLAHPVAPVPASAVLSGAILNAGLLGWLRFLPVGSATLPELGAVTLVGGLVAAFYGVAIGLAQRDPKVLLAYSSVSQMGFMTVGVGAGLLAPQLWPLLLPAVSLYAVHHALSKSALFLGVGVARAHGARPWILIGLALPALTLAGAPWTSGAVAKGALKTALHDLPGVWPAVLAGLLPLTALATGLLMVRLLVVVARGRDGDSRRGLGRRWSLSLAAVVGLAGWLGLPGVGAADIVEAAWPLLAAALIGGVAWRQCRRAPDIPAGDVLVLVEAGMRALRRCVANLRAPHWPSVARGRWRLEWAPLETALRAWAMAGGLWLVLFAALVGALFVAN